MTTHAEPRELTTTEAAKELGMAPATLKRWMDVVHVPHRLNSQGHRMIGDEGLEAIRAIQELRLDDPNRALESIRRVLTLGSAKKASQDQAQAEPQPTMGQAEAEPAPAEEAAAAGDDELSHGQARPQPEPGVSLEAIEARLVSVLRDNNDLAERYARVAHQVGVLEERVRSREEELARVLPAAAKASELEAQLKVSQALAAQMQQDLSQARAQLAAGPPPARGWLAKLLGR
jgi:DNA-binding transcriptional MerR regulator